MPNSTRADTATIISWHSNHYQLSQYLQLFIDESWEFTYLSRQDFPRRYFHIQPYILLNLNSFYHCSLIA